MIEEDSHDLVHGLGCVEVDGAESFDESRSVDRPDQLALDETWLTQASLSCGLHFNVKGQRAVRCCERGNDYRRESTAEVAGGTKHKSRSPEAGFTGVWLAKID